MTFSATLPIPPTANNLFPTSRSGHRFPSKKYKEWKVLAEKCFKTQNAPPFPIVGRLAVKYSYFFPDARRRDIANFEKALTDFLVAQKVFDDDCQIDEMQLVRLSDGLRGHVYIEVGVVA